MLYALCSMLYALCSMIYALCSMLCTRDLFDLNIDFNITPDLVGTQHSILDLSLPVTL